MAQANKFENDPAFFEGVRKEQDEKRRRMLGLKPVELRQTGLRPFFGSVPKAPPRPQSHRLTNLRAAWAERADRLVSDHLRRGDDATFGEPEWMQRARRIEFMVADHLPNERVFNEVRYVLSDFYRQSLLAWGSVINMANLKELGSGAFSTVYAIPREPRVVIKVNNVPDVGYLAFTRFMEKAEEKFGKDLPSALPRVYGRVVREFVENGEKRFAIVTAFEKLEPSVEHPLIRSAALASREGRSNGPDAFLRSLRSLTASSRDRQTEAVYDASADLLTFREQWNKEGGLATYIDMHQNNWMIRPSSGDIVMTDPLS